MNEIWKDIFGYEGFYQVSNLGNIKRLKTSFIRKDGNLFSTKERILKPTLREGQRKGYFWITLHKNDIKNNQPIHKLVAHAFLESKPFEKAEINHIDYNKLNNNSSNLEWVSHLQNMRHAFKNNKKLMDHAQSYGFRMREKNNTLSKEQVIQIRELFNQNMADIKIAEIFCVDRKTINNIRNGKSWGWFK